MSALHSIHTILTMPFHVYNGYLSNNMLCTHSFWTWPYTITLIALYFILIRYLMRSTFQPCIPEFKHKIQKYQFAWILQWLKSFPFDLCISLYNLTNHSYVFVGYYIKTNNIMMTSSNGNIFRVTGLCARNPPVTGEFPYKRQWLEALIFSLIYAWINACVNNREAGDLRCHRAHHGVIVMSCLC